MKSRLAGSLHRALPLAAALLLAGAAAAEAATFYLRTGSFDATMPDGRSVRMWGFGLCTDATPGSCAAPTVPGPRLELPAGDTSLTIELANDLAEPVSIMIPGQHEDGPTTVVPIVGGPYDGRIRAFTHEVAAGGAGTYAWSNLRPGTYLYQSASHPAKQVQMGLYGAVTADAVAGEAYGHAYDQDLLLVLSELDPALHDAVRDGQYGPGLAVTSTVYYEPKYFLVNGAPWDPGRSPMPLAPAGGANLLRFVNAGLLSHYPTIAWDYLTVIAEDGFPPVAPRVPLEAYHVDLHAAKTIDALVASPAAGVYPLFDRGGALAAADQPEGGMMARLIVDGGTQWSLTVAKDGTGTGSVVAASSPGGIDCGTDCAETIQDGTEIRLEAEPDPGSAFTGWTGPAGCSGLGDCVVTMDADQAVTATFIAAERVQVIYPNGGEQIPEGSLITIRWGAPATALHYTVQFSRNGGRRWRTIRRGVVGNSLLWQVPLFRRTQRRCKIRVIAFRNNGSRLGKDVSNGRFRILNVP